MSSAATKPLPRKSRSSAGLVSLTWVCGPVPLMTRSPVGAWPPRTIREPPPHGAMLVDQRDMDRALGETRQIDGGHHATETASNDGDGFPVGYAHEEWCSRRIGRVKPTRSAGRPGPQQYPNPEAGPKPAKRPIFWELLRTAKPALLRRRRNLWRGARRFKRRPRSSAS